MNVDTCDEEIKTPDFADSPLLAALQRLKQDERGAAVRSYVRSFIVVDDDDHALVATEQDRAMCEELGRAVKMCREQ